MPSTVERALDETVGQVQVEEVGVQPGRQAGGVGVPVEDVERRRVLAEQVVVDPVVPHEVVGAQPREDLGHVVAVEVRRRAASARGPPRRLAVEASVPIVDSGAVSRPATRNVAEFTRRARPWRRGGRAARASVTPPAHMPDHVGVVGAGDVAGDLDRLDAGGDVGVEVPVALLAAVGLRQLTVK